MGQRTRCSIIININTFIIIAYVSTHLCQYTFNFTITVLERFCGHYCFGVLESLCSGPLVLCRCVGL